MANNTLAVCMIVRNESKTITACLNKVVIVADQLVIVDTGSSDDTISKIGNWVSQGGYNDAVKLVNAKNMFHDSEGNFNFSDARNYSFSFATTDYVMWLDASDIIENPNNLKRSFLSASTDRDNVCIAVSTDVNGVKFLRKRIVPVEHAKMIGAVHEYLSVPSTLELINLPNIVITNHRNSDSFKRNTKIMIAEWEKEPTPRSAFYLGKGFHDIHDHNKAIEWFNERIKYCTLKNDYFPEERYKSYELMCASMMGVISTDPDIISKLDNATKQMIKEFPDRREGYFYKTEYLMLKKDWRGALTMLEKVKSSKKPTNIMLWLNKRMYDGSLIKRNGTYCLKMLASQK